MEKIASIFCAIVLAAFCASASYAQSAEPSTAQLREQVKQLESQVKKLEAQLKQQVADDMDIIAKVRAENRDLKKQIRHFKRDESIAKLGANQTAPNKSVAGATAATAGASDEKIAVAQAKSAVAKRETAAASPKAEVATKPTPAAAKNAEEDYQLPTEKKRDSVWNHMFPF